MRSFKHFTLLCVVRFGLTACSAPEPDFPPIDWSQVGNLRGVAGTLDYASDTGESVDRVLVVGDGGVMLYFDGYNWGRLPQVTGADLTAVVWSHTRWIVAGCSANERGIILTGSGSVWSEASIGDQPCLRGLARSQTETGYYARLTAVGDDGLVLESPDRGVTWSRLSAPTSADLTAVTATRDFAIIVGAAGTILKSSAGTVTAIASPTEYELLSVCAHDTHGIYASGISGTLLHAVGDVWTAIETGTSRHLRAVQFATVADYGQPTSNILVAGDDGTVLRLVPGGAPQAIRADTNRDLYSLWSDQLQGLGAPTYAVGADATLLELVVHEAR